MKLMTTLFLILTGFLAVAQNSSLTIFNNSGQPFFVIMNGIRQNSIPETNVKVSGMTTGAYEIKLIFADGKTGDVNKKLFLEYAGNYQARVAIKGKKRKLQFFGMSDGSPVPAGGTEIEYRPNDQSVYSDQSGTMNTGNAQAGRTTQQTGGYNGNGTANGQAGNNGQYGTNTNVIIQDPGATSAGGIQSTTTGNNGNGTFSTGTVVNDPNGGQFGVQIDINVQDPTMTGTGVGMNGTTTTTTTTSSSTTQNGQVMNETYNYQQSTSVTQNGQTTTTTQTGQSGAPVPGTTSGQTQTGTITTEAPVTDSPGISVCTNFLTDAAGFTAELKAASFDSNKRKLIQEEIDNKCLTTDQAYLIIETLSFDSDRLDMSKFLYSHLTDKSNGKRLLELFSFDADKQEFRDYMRKH